MDVKKTVKVLLKCLACLILLAGVSLGGFFLGKATVPKPLSWTETDAFVATVVDYQGDFLLVQGAPINDGAHQGQFSFFYRGGALVVAWSFSLLCGSETGPYPDDRL